MSDFLFYIISPEVQASILPLKVLFLALSLFFIGFLIFFLLKTRWLRLIFLYGFIEFFTLKTYGSILTKLRWKLFIWRLYRVKEINFKKAIVRCHEIFDKVLIGLVPLHQSNTYAERLAKVGVGTFSNIDELWWSYELYRSAKKDQNSIINFNEFKRVLTAFHTALEELEII
jgi:hypothetical protein